MSARTSTSGLSSLLGWSRLLQLAVTVALVVVIARNVDMAAVGRELGGADPAWLLLALGIAVVDRALVVVKWLPLLRVQLPAVSMWRAARVSFASNFASLIVPTLGGDLLRGVALGRERHGGGVAEVGASIFAERVLGMLGGGVMAGVALALAVRSGIEVRGVTVWALAAAGVPLVALFAPLVVRRLPGASRSGPLGWTVRFARRFGIAYEVYRSHVGRVALVGALSIVKQISPIAIYWVLAHSIDADVGWTMLFVAAPLTAFASRLPVSMWGLGVTEGSLVYLLGLFGVAPATALSVSLLGRGVEMVTLAPGALMWRELVASGRGTAGDEEGDGLEGLVKPEQPGLESD